MIWRNYQDEITSRSSRGLVSPAARLTLADGRAVWGQRLPQGRYDMAQPKKFEQIILDIEDGIAILTLNRPEKMNALRVR